MDRLSIEPLSRYSKSSAAVDECLNLSFSFGRVEDVQNDKELNPVQI